MVRDTRSDMAKWSCARHTHSLELIRCSPWSTWNVLTDVPVTICRSHACLADRSGKASHTHAQHVDTWTRHKPSCVRTRIQIWRPLDPHGAYHDGTLQMYKVTAVSEGTCSNEGAQNLYDKASGVVGTNPPDPAPFSYNTAPTIFRCSWPKVWT